MPESKYVIIVGAGKVGWNLARELLDKGNEVTVVENNRERYLTVEQELEHSVQYGDASELWVLERAGISRADMVIAVTGDDEDNMLICQVAKEKYLVDRIIARVNNPRNRQHFELLGVKPYVATDLILRLLEHEVPEYGLVHCSTCPRSGWRSSRCCSAMTRGWRAGGWAISRCPRLAADLGAPAGAGRSCRRRTPCWRPATRCSPCWTPGWRRTSRSSSAPTVRPSRRRASRPWLSWRRTSFWSGAAWRPPTARPSCGGAGRRRRSCW